MSLPSPDEGNRSSFRNFVFSSFLEYRAMDKVRTPSNSDGQRYWHKSYFVYIENLFYILYPNIVIKNTFFYHHRHFSNQMGGHVRVCSGSSSGSITEGFDFPRHIGGFQGLILRRKVGYGLLTEDVSSFPQYLQTDYRLVHENTPQSLPSDPLQIIFRTYPHVQV
jgi:hypothetical protein